MRINILHIIGFFTGFILVMFLMFILQGCTTTKYVPVVERRDSIITRSDTTIIKDSIFVDRYFSGDTLYLDKYVYKYIERISNDTIYQNKEIPVVKEVETVKDVIPSWVWWLVAVVGIYIIYKGVRLGIKIYTKVQSGGLL